MNPNDLHRRLQDPEFRAKLIEYLELIIKLDYDWANDPDEVAIYGQPKSDHASYRFPRYDEAHNGAAELEEGLADGTDPYDTWVE
jgi:hypothetical protein